MEVKIKFTKAYNKYKARYGENYKNALKTNFCML